MLRTRDHPKWGCITRRGSRFGDVQKLARYRDEMRKYCYDPSKYDTYLQQLGITYPTVTPVP